jgi:peptidyl-prolyl cis-trans isomerase C
MKKCFIFAFVFVLLCSKENIPKDGIINIDGKWISKTEVDRYIDIWREQMMRVMPQQSLEGVPPEVKKNIALQLIANELTIKEAKKRHIQCDSVKFEKTLSEISKQFRDKETMKKELEKMGKTEQAMRDQIRDGLMVEALLKTIVKPSDTATTAECKAFYDSNTQQFAAEKKMRVSQIFMPTKKQMADLEKKSIFEKMQKIASDLQGGKKDFTESVKKYSQDPNAASGGDIGWFKKGDMRPDFEKVAIGLKADEISSVFETEAGYHIIKKTGEETLPPKKFEDVRQQIGTRLSLMRQNDVVQKFVDSLMTLSTITYTDTSYKPSPLMMAPKKK